jgi:hypothetical protein
MLSRFFGSKKPVGQTIQQLTLPTAETDDPHDGYPDNQQQSYLPPTWQQVYWSLIEESSKERDTLPLAAKQSILEWWDSLVPREDNQDD